MRKGHTIGDIGDYTLGQFVRALDAVAEIEAQERLDFVSDMTAVVGSLFSKESPVADHVASLSDAAAGVKVQE